MRGSSSSLQGFTLLYRFFTYDWFAKHYDKQNGTALNRLSFLICGIVLLTTASSLLAQRGGHGTSAGRSPAGTNPVSNTSDISDFNRSIALQASPDQIARFQQLTKSMDTARNEAQDLIHPAGDSKKPDSSRYADLNDAVQEAQSNNRQFVFSFSLPQQSELKLLIKKLKKADSDLSKQSKALAQELERLTIDGSKINNVVEKLNQALTTFQADVLDVGKEMGIQPQEHSQ
jgi:hypothetical protein